MDNNNMICVSVRMTREEYTRLYDTKHAKPVTKQG